MSIVSLLLFYSRRCNWTSRFESIFSSTTRLVLRLAVPHALLFRAVSGYIMIQFNSYTRLKMRNEAHPIGGATNKICTKHVKVVELAGAEGGAPLEGARGCGVGGESRCPGLRQVMTCIDFSP